jgi:hypothetical protein
VYPAEFHAASPDLKFFRKKNLVHKPAVDKLVHNLFMAARNWPAQVQNLKMGFCQQSSC